MLNKRTGRKAQTEEKELIVRFDPKVCCFSARKNNKLVEASKMDICFL